MKNFFAAAALLAILISATGCGSSASEVVGTLPIVTGITVDTLASRGDTIVVTWTAIDSTLVDGYFLWYRSGIDGIWNLAATTTGNSATHIASYSAYYTVMAYKGLDTSTDVGMSDKTKTEGIEEIRQVFEGRPVAFRVDVENGTLVSGDPADPLFQQHFTVCFGGISLTRYVYPGGAHPDIWPGGARTRISDIGGFVAPSPADTVAWDDSITYGNRLFLELDDGHYCLLDCSQTFPDTVSMTDSLVIDGQLQPITGVRVFNMP